MLEKEKVDIYLRFRRLAEFPLTFVGIWPTEKSYWYRLLRYTHLINCSITVMAIINYLLHHGNSINIVIRVVSYLTGTSLYALRLLIFTINRKELMILHANLSDFCEQIINESRLIVPVFKRISVCFRLAVVVTVGLWGSFFMILAVFPFINLMMQIIRDPANAKYLTVFPSRYPWHTTSDGFAFRMTYLIESLSAFNGCMIASGVDSLILFYVFQATSQLRAMAYRVSHIRESENYDDVMRTCAIHYAMVIKCCKDLERIYEPIILIIVGSSAILLCTLMYQLSQATALTRIQMARVAVYIIAKSSQVYLYTWSGTLLREESEKYLKAVYLSNWLGTKSARIVLITISQRPLTIKACHILLSSVETFAKTMNTTISYFLLLRTIA